MLLTNKAKFDFLDWLVNNHEIDLKGFELGKDVIQNALIVEWLDSVGIYVLIEKTFNDFWYKIKESRPEITKVHIGDFDSSNRNTTTSKAIEKANEIYNSK